MTDAASQAPLEDPGDDADTTEILFHLFVMLSRNRDARLDRALRPLNINASRHRAISVIAVFGPCPMGELAALSCVDRTTMTRTVDQLVSAGLVERVTPPADRRQVLLSLTKTGREVYQRATAVMVAVDRETAKGVPEAFRRTMIHAQRTMIGNLIGDEIAVDRIVNFRRALPPDTA